MINATELRIGNIVLDPYNNEREVTGVRGGYVWVTQLKETINSPIYLSDELSPVPITDEVLWRIDFGKNKDPLCFSKGLHWLQNEYFFRTEKELPVSKVL